MSEMFFGCSYLKEINITNFCLSKVNDKNYMFNYCSKDLKNTIRTKFPNLFD